MYVSRTFGDVPHKTGVQPTHTYLASSQLICTYVSVILKQFLQAQLQTLHMLPGRYVFEVASHWMSHHSRFFEIPASWLQVIDAATAAVVAAAAYIPPPPLPPPSPPAPDAYVPPPPPPPPAPPVHDPWFGPHHSSDFAQPPPPPPHVVQQHSSVVVQTMPATSLAPVAPPSVPDPWFAQQPSITAVHPTTSSISLSVASGSAAHTDSWTCVSTVNSSWLVIPNSASQHEPSQSATDDVANLDDVFKLCWNGI